MYTIHIFSICGCVNSGIFYSRLEEQNMFCVEKVSQNGKRNQRYFLFKYKRKQIYTRKGVNSKIVTSKYWQTSKLTMHDTKSRLMNEIRHLWPLLNSLHIISNLFIDTSTQAKWFHINKPMNVPRTILYESIVTVLWQRYRLLFLTYFWTAFAFIKTLCAIVIAHRIINVEFFRKYKSLCRFGTPEDLYWSKNLVLSNFKVNIWTWKW